MEETPKNGNTHRYWNIVKRIFQSANFALLLSVAFFAYEMNSSAEDSKKIVDDLVKIQNSLSTRYLGIFPEYIGGINNLLEQAIEHHDKVKDKDAIVVCEDVLYYGIRSDVDGFRKMLSNLITLSDLGCSITIAYYATDGFPFKNMINNSLISTTQQRFYRNDMMEYRKRLNAVRRAISKIPSDKSHEEREMIIKEAIDKNFAEYIGRQNSQQSYSQLLNQLSNMRMVDSIVCEKHFALSNRENPDKLNSLRADMLRPIPMYENKDERAASMVNELCVKLEAIKQRHLSKPCDKILYADIQGMYEEFTFAIADMLKGLKNVELIPIREDLMMSCWMTMVNGEHTAIIAFPSKYSSDEIGFISQDAAFSNYIQTMLNGMKLSHAID